MSELKGVYIVLLNWNGWRDSIACLESLIPNIRAGARVLVCDNHSSDESLNHIQAWARHERSAGISQHPRLAALQAKGQERPVTQRISRREAEAGLADPDAELILVDNGGNLGFAAGNNVGLRFALAQEDMQHVWLLNNDTLVEANCLPQMLNRLQAHNRPAVCGSVIHFFDDPSIIQCIGGNRFDALRGRALESEGRYLEEGAMPDVGTIERQLDYLTGCSMLLPRSFLETVGLMNEAYFLYYEEIDWFTRAARRFDLLVADGAHLYHREGGSIGSRSWNRGPSLISDQYMFRSRMHFMRSYYPRDLWRCTLSNWLDVVKRVVKGQWRNAAVIARELNRPSVEAQ
ncbi:glycosyltransferase [Congregibacter litoralis]|uniref:Putative glycosyltransferase n=1 Tax=Congregibacter litoralis KT71 TaxID=314285 RepID=A4AB85_9GAMM|nr:glycosyltransferase [Congregibacter litoralis]EAQ96639.1 putative glycosyltransferase [Congregibacter litoralis KT71]